MVIHIIPSLRLWRWLATSDSCSTQRSLCRCGEGIQARLVAPAVISFLIFSCGFPIFIYYIVVVKYRDLIKEDQLLRAAGIGDSPETNPKAWWIRQRYEKLYYHFKPGKVYWIVYIVLRKFAIAFSALMFRGSPGFQLAMILLVLFVCFVAQVQNRPYMSTAERDLVLHEHRVKAQEGDTTHEAIEDVIAMGIRKIDAEKEKKARMQNRRMSFVFQGVDLKMNEVEQVRDYFWDYNTVEMVLLACSILVCLAGVMFESDRFNQGRKDLDFQRLMITFGVMFVIGFSMFYYSIVFLAEVTGKTPEWIKKLMTRSKLGNLKANTSGAGEEGDDDDDDFGIELASNPLASSDQQATEALERAKALEADLERLREGHKRSESMNTQLMRQLAAEKMKNQKLQAASKKPDRSHARTRSRGTSRNTFGQKKIERKGTKGKGGRSYAKSRGA